MDSAESKAYESSYRVVVHAPCVNCRYDLFTLDPESKCPECGEPIRPSLVAFATGLKKPSNDDRLVTIATANWITSFLLIAMSGLIYLSGPHHSCCRPQLGALGFPLFFVWPVLPVVTLVRLSRTGSRRHKSAAGWSLVFLMGVIVDGCFRIQW